MEHDPGLGEALPKNGEADARQQNTAATPHQPASYPPGQTRYDAAGSEGCGDPHQPTSYPPPQTPPIWGISPPAHTDQSPPLTGEYRGATEPTPTMHTGEYRGATVAGGEYRGATAAQRQLPLPDAADVLFALFALTMGFFFWEWEVALKDSGTGIGATLFFCLSLAGTCIYLHRKGIRQTRTSLALLGLAVAASIPFALFGTRSIDLQLLIFVGCLCALWLAYSCKTLIASKLSALLVFDLISQTLLSPVMNFGQLFHRGIRGLGKKKVWAHALLALTGVLIALPLIWAVVVLLMNSDDGFNTLVLEITRSLDTEAFIEYGFKFVLGIPIACYLFGAVIGNAFKHNSPFFEKEALERAFVSVHRLPRIALYGTLSLLVLIYFAYFFTMGSYLFSALQGTLPAEYTYAEYARKGFFELCGVAVINLCILAVVWIFASRGKDEHPVFLRILTGLIVALTCVLIIIAASKLWLYIQVYGLTLLRVYTSWFMILLVVVFVLLLLWHIKPFNVAKPLIIATIALVLLLSYTNVDGLIARYNVDSYLSGKTEHIDPHALEQLSDAAVPALRDLQECSTDLEVVEGASRALSVHELRHHRSEGVVQPWEEWFSANLESALVWREG